MSKLMDILTTSGLSPSALNTYINCSLQYYFRYIAGLRETDDVEENIDSATIGSAVHYALEKMYEPYTGRTVEVKDIDALIKDTGKAAFYISEELGKRFDKESLRYGKNYLLYNVCVKLVADFLKHEKQHLQYLHNNGVSMQIEVLESKFQVPISVNGKVIMIQGRVDRIERVNDILRIADFKTSSKSTIPVLTEETWDKLMSEPKYSKTVQLLIYAWLYHKQHSSLDTNFQSGIYWLRALDKQLDTLRVNKDNDFISSVEILQFEEKLKQLLGELTDTEIPFTKTNDSKRCEYCDFANICGRN